MTESSPPFDPPYITIYETGCDTYCIETLPDGSKRPVPMSTKVFQPSISNADKKTPMPKEPNIKKLGNSTNSERQAFLYLTVPFAEKDNAKSLGAKWDALKKKWYVPHGLDVNLFNRWRPED